MDKYIKRKKKNNDYEYYTIKNIKINDKNILDKIKKIYIPPAYKDVKIYLNKNILATGVDIAGRKQYIYSEYSKKQRENKKYCQLFKLSNNILKLKKQISDDLLLKDFTKNKLIALILKIMDLCNFRSGNKKYEKMYGSYGLTTLHKKHVIIKKDFVEIDFIGKKGVINNCIIKNKPIQDIIEKVYKLSSKNDPYIFSIIYNNEPITITMVDLNKYLEQFMITCKDLRTWNANIIFLKNFKNEIDDFFINNHIDHLKKVNSAQETRVTGVKSLISSTNKCNICIESFEKSKKKLVKEAIKKTAISLHHTPTICKSSYIFKNIIEQIDENNKMCDELRKNNVNIENILKIFLLDNSTRCERH